VKLLGGAITGGYNRATPFCTQKSIVCNKPVELAATKRRCSTLPIAGESKTFPGAKEFMEAHGVEVIDLDLAICKQLMLDFIQGNPVLWQEDIGEL
jgi:hypothetical protein